MANAKKITAYNHLPGKGDGKFRVYSQQFNELVDNINKDGIVELTTSITANTGSTQATGTALTAEYNIVTTCATAGDAVTLPAAEAGKRVIVMNLGAAACDVFPASGDQIDDLSADAAISVGIESRVELIAYNGTNWQSDIESLSMVGPISIVDTSTTDPSFTVTNDAALTTDVVNISGTGVFTGVDASSFVTVTQSGATSGDVVSVIADGLTTGTALKLDSSGVLATTGAMLEILADGATSAAGIIRLTADGLTTGIGQLIEHTTSVIADGGSLMSLTSTGIDTAATTGAVLNVSSTAQAVGNTVLIASNGLTTGTAMEVSSSGTIVTTGDVLSVVGNTATTSTGLLRVSGTALTDGWVAQLTGGGVNATASGGVLDIVSGASTLGSGIKIVSTGAATSTTVGHLMELQDDSNALGIGVHATFDALTTGEGVLIDHTTSVIADGGSLMRLSSGSVDTGGATNGTVLDVQSSGQLAGTVALIESIVTTGSALEINSTGAYTGTAGVLAVNGTNSTTGDLVVFTGGGAGQSTAAGSVLQINNAGATDGSDVEVNHSTGVYIGTKGIVDIDANATTTGTIVDINGVGLTSGNALIITGGGANFVTGGSVARFDAGASTAGSGLEIVSTGDYTGTDGLLNITANTATTGDIGIVVSATAQTSGNIISVTGGGANLVTGGSIARFDMGAAIAGSGLEIVTSGVYTGSDGLLLVDGSSATTGTLAHINGSSLSGAGIALLVDSNGVTAISTDGAIESSLNAGTAGTNVTAQEFSDGRNYTTVLTLASVSYTVAAAAAEAIGALIYTLPAGAQHVEVAYMSVGLTGGGVVDADTPDVGVGTVIASGANALLSANAAFEDIIDGQTASNCTGTAAVALLKPDDELSVAGDVKAIHFNIAYTWAGADTVTASGTVTIKWTQMS